MNIEREAIVQTFSFRFRFMVCLALSALYFGDWNATLHAFGQIFALELVVESVYRFWIRFKGE